MNAGICALQDFCGLVLFASTNSPGRTEACSNAFSKRIGPWRDTAESNVEAGSQTNQTVDLKLMFKGLFQYSFKGSSQNVKELLKHSVQGKVNISF